MSDITMLDAPAAPEVQEHESDCPDCQGSGGWFRYEPALDPGPGRLYLSCVGCRGSGRMALARG